MTAGFTPAGIGSLASSVGTSQHRPAAYALTSAMTFRIARGPHVPRDVHRLGVEEVDVGDADEPEDRSEVALDEVELAHRFARVVAAARRHADHLPVVDQRDGLADLVVLEEISRLDDGVDVVLERIRDPEVPHGNRQQVDIGGQKPFDRSLDLIPGKALCLIDRLTRHERVLGLDVRARDRRQVGAEQVQRRDVDVVVLLQGLEENVRDTTRVRGEPARRGHDVKKPGCQLRFPFRVWIPFPERTGWIP